MMDLESLRKLCLSFAGVKEDIKWEHDLCFLVGDKMFCVTGLEQPSPVSFKVKPEEFEEMVSKNGIEPAPYLARASWVAVQKSSALSQNEWKFYVGQSYELIKSKLPAKLRNNLKG